MAFPQQVDDGLTPIALNDFLFEVNRPPGTVFEAQSSASDGQMNVRMLIELAAVGMQGYKQAYFDIKLFGPLLVAQAKSLLSRGQLLAKAGQSLSGMVKVMCCHLQLGRMYCCSAIHCSVAFRRCSLCFYNLGRRIWCENSG